MAFCHTVHSVIILSHKLKNGPRVENDVWEKVWDVWQEQQRAAAAAVRSVGRSNERDATEGKHHTAAGGRTRPWQPIMYRVQLHLTKTIYFLRAAMW